MEFTSGNELGLKTATIEEIYAAIGKLVAKPFPIQIQASSETIGRLISNQPGVMAGDCPSSAIIHGVSVERADYLGHAIFIKMNDGSDILWTGKQWLAVPALKPNWEMEI